MACEIVADSEAGSCYVSALFADQHILPLAFIDEEAERNRFSSSLLQYNPSNLPLTRGVY